MDFLNFQRELNGRYSYRYDLRSESFFFKCPSTGIELVLPKTSIVDFKVRVTPQDHMIWLHLRNKVVVMLAKREIIFPFDASNLYSGGADFNYWTTLYLKDGILKFIANKEDMGREEIIRQIDYHSNMIESAIKLGFKMDHYRWLMSVVKEGFYIFGDHSFKIK